MPWRRVYLTVDRDRVDTLSDSLEAAGAIAITLEDASGTPLIELAWEQTPAWPRVRVNALFPDATDLSRLSDWLRSAGADSQFETDMLPDRDWGLAWKEHYRPTQVGHRLWVCPSWCDPPQPDAINIRLDPGLAFGTGTHATTALCLEWLSQQPLAGAAVIDYGCGSGILAIAALLLGAERAIGVDNDPRALTVSRENAAGNDVSARLQLHLPESLPADVTADVVVANILAPALIDLAPCLTALARPGARLALAGLLATQADEVRAAYAHRFQLTERTRDEWALLATPG